MLRGVTMTDAMVIITAIAAVAEVHLQHHRVRHRSSGLSLNHLVPDLERFPIVRPPERRELLR